MEYKDEGIQTPIVSPGITPSIKEPVLPTVEGLQSNISQRSNKLPKIILYVSASLLLIALGAAGFWIYQEKIAKQLSPTVTPTPSPAGMPEVTPSPATTPSVKEKTYTNPTFNITLKYPSDWFGPEVTESKDGFFFQIGTDTVYPYGTDRLDKIYTRQNSYYISLQYTKKPEDISVEQYKKSQPWIQQYLPLLSMKDGESSSSVRSLLIRVKEVDIGGFNGVEYISTLPDTAQTEMAYGRELFLINDSYDTIRITGTPNNVTVKDKQNWKLDWQQVDEAYLQTFRKFVNLVSLRK